MKINSWIVSFLLLSFVVLVTPRTLWHDCAHEVESSNHQKSSGFTFDKKVSTCDFCDYDLSLSEEPLSFLRIKQRITFLEKPTFYKSLYVQHFVNQELRRGPPTILC
jgi:hypothetical protein